MTYQLQDGKLMTEEQFVILATLIIGILIGFVANHIYHRAEIKEINEIINAFRESMIARIPAAPVRRDSFEYDGNVSDFLEEVEKLTIEVQKQIEHPTKNT